MTIEQYKIAENQFTTDYGVRHYANRKSRQRIGMIYEALVDLASYVGDYDPVEKLRRLGVGNINSVVEAQRYIVDMQAGRHRLWETQSMGDFPALTSELMNKRLRARFMAAPSFWDRYTPRNPSPLMDFKNVYPLTIDRDSNSTTYGKPIPAGGSFGYTSFKDGQEPYKADKYIEGWRATFELLRNSFGGMMDQVVGYMLEDAQFVLEQFVVNLHCDASGPDANVYTAGNGNIIIDGATTNPQLSLSALQAGIGQLKDAVGPGGRPIVTTNNKVLVVGTGKLEAIAQQIINTMEIRNAEPSGGTRVQRPFLPAIEIICNPYIKTVVTTNLDTSWWLFNAPGPVNTRNWAEVGFLQNFEAPRILQKAPNALNLDGSINAEVGDFHSWSQEWAHVIAFGGRTFASAAQTTVASNGTEVA